MKCDVRLTRNYRFAGNVLKDKCGIFIFLLVALSLHNNTCNNTCDPRILGRGIFPFDGAADDGRLRRGGVNKSHVGSMSPQFKSAALLAGNRRTN